MEKIIAIINNSYMMQAFIFLKNDGLASAIHDTSVAPAIEKLFTSLKKSDPSIRVVSYDPAKHSAIHGRRTVRIDEPEYLSAVLDECEAQGLRALLIPELLQETMLTLGRPAFTPEQRKAILGEIIYAEEDDVREVAAATRKMLAIGEEIKKNRESFLRELRKKTDH